MKLIALPISFICISAVAQVEGLPQAIQRRALPIYGIEKSLFGYNPGAMWYRDTLSLSEAKASAERLDMECAIFPQNGKGKTGISLGANSYQHLDENQTVWGDAMFSTGSIEDVEWCNCIDYDLIAPYVLGDGVGGNLNFRKYNFGGGYSYAFSDNLCIGATLNYRAEIAWRDVDPRIKTIVSDLHFSAGASYRLTRNRIVGLSASVTSYSQNCDLDFYNPLNDIIALPLTGLGTYYKRFTGNENKNSGHIGIGYGIYGQSISIDGNGLQIELGVDVMRMNQLLRNFNNITLAYTDTYCTHAKIGYSLNLSSYVKAFPFIGGKYSRRIGTENLFGAAAGASYDRIGSRKPYLNERIDASAVVPVETKFGRGYLTISPSVRYVHYSESLTSVLRSIAIDNIEPCIDVQYSTVCSHNWLLTVCGGYRVRNSFSDSCIMPGYDADSDLQRSVVSLYDMLSARNQFGRLSISVSHLFGNIMAGIEAGYDHTSYRDHGNANHFYATLSINF